MNYTKQKKKKEQKESRNISATLFTENVSESVMATSTHALPCTLCVILQTWFYSRYTKMSVSPLFLSPFISTSVIWQICQLPKISPSSTELKFQYSVCALFPRQRGFCAAALSCIRSQLHRSLLLQKSEESHIIHDADVELHTDVTVINTEICKEIRKTFVCMWVWVLVLVWVCVYIYKTTNETVWRK